MGLDIERVKRAIVQLARRIVDPSGRISIEPTPWCSVTRGGRPRVELQFQWYRRDASGPTAEHAWAALLCTIDGDLRERIEADQATAISARDAIDLAAACLRESA